MKRRGGNRNHLKTIIWRGWIEKKWIDQDREYREDKMIEGERIEMLLGYR